MLRLWFPFVSGTGLQKSLIWHSYAVQHSIEVNIRIIRVFTRLREYTLAHTEILRQLAKLEKEVD